MGETVTDRRNDRSGFHVFPFIFNFNDPQLVMVVPERQPS